MEKVKYKFRKPELDQYRASWLTKSGYELLRIEKKRQGLSMAKLIDNLIKEKYGNE